MKISKDTHSQVILWVENDLLDKFDQVANREKTTRSELLRNSMKSTVKRNRMLT